jgi:hypothetical protein
MTWIFRKGIRSMTRCFHSLAVAALVVFVGCNQSNDQSQQAARDQDSRKQETQQPAETGPVIHDETPSAAVTQFFTALQQGDQQVIDALLTTQARAAIEANPEYGVQSVPNPDAKFEVGTVTVIDDPPGAHVQGIWSEPQPTGPPEGMEVAWILRNEPIGWRVMGLAVKTDAEPLVINFEDPADAHRKKQEALREAASGFDSVAPAYHAEAPGDGRLQR